MQEEDPTAVEPDEKDLPDKPPIEDMPEEGHPAPSDDEEAEVDRDEPMEKQEAANDPTIDDEEDDTKE
jgi:hypothetical protein